MRLLAISSIVVLVGACSSTRRVTLQAQDSATGVVGDVQQQDGSPPTSAPDGSDVRVRPDAMIIPDVTRVPDATIADVTVPDFGPSCVHPPVVANCNNGWCSIPAGCFMMGSPPNEPCRGSNETQHQVTLTHSFEMQQTEVTQAQFESLMGYNTAWYGPDKPGAPTCSTSCAAEDMGWDDAVKYCNELSQKKGLAQCYLCNNSCASSPAYFGPKIYTCPGYRLPTEAEWEYAYRAGTTTAYYSGPVSSAAPSCDSCYAEPILDTIAWYCKNASTPMPVGQKAPNGWGLFDMAGNVFELCHDGYTPYLGAAPVTDPCDSGSMRVVRGGSWLDADPGGPYQSGPAHARAAARGFVPTGADPWVGFRCVRTLTPSCGNGVLDANEACDEGQYNADTPGATCRTDCVLCGTCGNGSEGDFIAATSTTLAGGVHHFTSFIIQPGATVTVTGSTPLSLYVRGQVNIAGSLTLSGSAGGKGACWYSPAGTAGKGGGGGGAAGGTGGWHDPSLSPDTYAGSDGQGPGGGHAPPGSGDLMVGGGAGGAGYAVAGTAGGAGICCPSRCGDQSDFPGGLGGNPYGAPNLDNKLIGGSGGGGGHHGHADNGSGGGGGGGGGALLIIAPSIMVGGKILANGGEGGDACPDLDGGGGGGGSGGTIWLRAAAVNITGTVSATGGSAGAAIGVGGSCGLGGGGGNGSDGRIRVDAVTFTGGTTPTAFAGTTLCRGAPCE